MLLSAVLFAIQRVLVFSSPTLDINYDPYQTRETHCHGNEEPVKRPYFNGQRGCGTPLQMLDFVEPRDCNFVVLLGNITENADFHQPLTRLLKRFSEFGVPVFPAFGLLDVMGKPASVLSLYYARFHEHNLFGRHADQIRRTFESCGYYGFHASDFDVAILNPFCYRLQQLEFLREQCQRSFFDRRVLHVFSSRPVSEFALHEEMAQIMHQHAEHVVFHTTEAAAPFQRPNTLFHPSFNALSSGNCAYRILLIDRGILKNFYQLVFDPHTAELELAIQLADLGPFKRGFSAQGVVAVAEAIETDYKLFQQVKLLVTSEIVNPIEEYCQGFGISVEQYLACLEEADFA